MAPDNVQLQLNMYMSNDFQNPRGKNIQTLPGFVWQFLRRQLFTQKFEMNRTQWLAYFPKT